MARILTQRQLLDELREVAGSTRRAKLAIDRAVALGGLGGHESLSESDLLIVCEALASEGGAVQQWAEALATDTLRESLGPNRDSAA